MALRSLGVVTYGFPTEEEAAEALALISDTVTSPATSPVPLILSQSAIPLRSCASSVDDKVVCCQTKDQLTRSCLCLVIRELFVELS